MPPTASLTPSGPVAPQYFFPATLTKLSLHAEEASRANDLTDRVMSTSLRTRQLWLLPSTTPPPPLIMQRPLVEIWQAEPATIVQRVCGTYMMLWYQPRLRGRVKTLTVHAQVDSCAAFQRVAFSRSQSFDHTRAGKVAGCRDNNNKFAEGCRRLVDVGVVGWYRWGMLGLAMGSLGGRSCLEVKDARLRGVVTGIHRRKVNPPDWCCTGHRRRGRRG